MTLQNQLRLISGTTVLLVAAVVGVAMWNLRNLQEEFHRYQINQEVHQALIEIKATALSIAQSDPILEETEARLDEVDGQVHGLFRQIESEVRDPERLNTVRQMAGTWDEYAKGFRGAIKIAADNPVDALNIPGAMYKLKLAPMVDRLDTLAEAYQGAERVFRGRIEAAVARILKVIVGPLIGAGIAIVIFPWMFWRGLSRRISQIIKVVEKLKAGDLRHRLPVKGRNEVSRMASALNGFIDRFVVILRDVKQAAESTEVTAHEVNQMTRKVTENAKAQSDRFFQVSSAIDQMGQSLSEMVSTVAHAAGSASDTRSRVGRGNDTGQQTVSALTRIDETVATSSVTISELEAAIQRIGDVSAIIKEIAEQTNLLALNAAIEAARAGKHGRGFAVVAGEVRDLAKRTAASTNDIFNIVEAIQKSTSRATGAMLRAREEVGNGVRFGEEMGRLLSEIDLSVHEMTDMMQRIAHATEEQSAAGNEISRNVEEVAEITSSTNRDIEATEFAMAGLVRVSERLHETVAQFHLTEATEGGAA